MGNPIKQFLQPQWRYYNGNNQIDTDFVNVNCILGGTFQRGKRSESSQKPEWLQRSLGVLRAVMLMKRV